MSPRKLVAWLPALILPGATIAQLLALLDSGSAENVSPLTWFMFMLANVGALYLGRPEGGLARLQMALAFGLTALLDLIIVAIVIVYQAAESSAIIGAAMR